MNARRRTPALASLAACLAAATLAPRAEASGFQLREQSPSGQGTAFAGVSAGGADIGSMFFNPASLTRYEGTQAILGASYVMPKAELKDGVGTRAASFPAPTRPIRGSASQSNAAESAALPNLYAMWSLSQDLKLGLSINAPFGLSTEYDANSVVRYHALRSDLTVVDIAPSIAYRINPRWSVGAALVARRAEATLSNAVDFASVMAAKGAPVVPGSLDGTATLKGSRWAYGYRLGVLFEPTDKVRLGLAYHSAVSMTLEGDVSYAGVPAALASTFVNGAASADLNLPSTASLGLQVDLNDRLTLMGEVQRTGWSSFKELRVKFAGGLPDSVTEENWQDTWFLGLGLAWKATDKWTLRTGLAYDQSAVTDAYRTPRIPDGDRTWVSMGAGYTFNRRSSVDFAYTHIFVTSGALDLKAVPAGTTAATSPNTLRGDLSGSYTSSIDILSAQVKFAF